MLAFLKDCETLYQRWGIWKLTRSDAEKGYASLSGEDVRGLGAGGADGGSMEVGVWVSVAYPRGCTKVVNLKTGRLYLSHNERIGDALDSACVSWMDAEEEACALDYEYQDNMALVSRVARHARSSSTHSGKKTPRNSASQHRNEESSTAAAAAPPIHELENFLLSQINDGRRRKEREGGTSLAAIVRESPDIKALFRTGRSAHGGGGRSAKQSEEFWAIGSAARGLNGVTWISEGSRHARPESDASVAIRAAAAGSRARTVDESEGVLLFSGVEMSDWPPFRCHALNLTHGKSLGVVMRWKNRALKKLSSIHPSSQLQWIGALIEAEVLTAFQPEHTDFNRFVHNMNWMEKAVSGASNFGALNWYLTTSLQNAIDELVLLWKEHPCLFLARGSHHFTVFPTSPRLDSPSPAESPLFSARTPRSVSPTARTANREDAAAASRATANPNSTKKSPAKGRGKEEEGGSQNEVVGTKALALQVLKRERETAEPGTVVSIVRMLQHLTLDLLETCTQRCLMCGKPLLMQTVRQGICDTALCQFAVDQYGLGVDVLSEMKQHPAVVELLISLTCASAHNDKRDTFSPMCPVDIGSSLSGSAQFYVGGTATCSLAAPVAQIVNNNGAIYSGPTNFYRGVYGDSTRKNFRLLRYVIQSIPSISTMIRASSGSNAQLRSYLNNINPLIYPLVQWILSSNRAHLEVIEEAHRIPELGPHQFILLSCSPQREAAFQRRKREMAVVRGTGSFFAWHGSPCFNWHCILREGLKVLSGTKLMSTGQLYGSGIYLAEFAAMAIKYVGKPESPWSGAEIMKNPQGCVLLSLCEVINDPRKYCDHGNQIYTVSSEEDIVTRFLFVFPGGFTNRTPLTASGLNISPELLARTSYVSQKSKNTKVKSW